MVQNKSRVEKDDGRRILSHGIDFNYYDFK